MAAFRKSLSHGHETNELEAFVNMLEPREMEEVTTFSHVTDDDHFRKTFETGMIEPRKIEEPYWSRLAREDAPKGVLFEVSMYHGELQKKSKHGDTRLKLPCHFVLQGTHQPRMFLESFYYYQTAPKNQHVRLILLDGARHPKEYEWCMNNCVRRVNPLNNDILILDRDKNKFEVCKNDGFLFPYVWVEVLVVGEVKTMAVDTVSESNPSKVEPTEGVVPPLKIREGKSTVK